MALWKARYCFIKIGNAVSDPGSSSSDFFTQLATNTTSVEKTAKDATFKEPERDSDIVLLLGTTSSNQNAELNEKGSDNAELTCTLIMNPEPDNDFDLMKYKLTVHGTIATGYDTRYNYASASPSAGIAVCVQFSDGTNKVNVLMNNATITTLGGFKIEADGHAEQEVKIISTPDDCWIEENFTAG